MGENPNLKLLVEGLGYLATIIVSVAGVYAMRLRARQNEMALSKNVDPKSLPNIGIILIVFGCALLASLFARHPEVAQRLLPPAESAELATAEAAKPKKSATVNRSVCASSKDCSAGSICDRGRCTPPRRLSELQQGSICAGCEPMPWMEPQAPALALR